MNNIDEVRAFLLSKGQQHIEIDGLTQLVDESKMNRGKFLAAFYRLRSMGEISTETSISDGGRKSVNAVNLHKMPAVSTMIHNTGERKKRAIKPVELKPNSPLPNVTSYLQKKNVIKDIKEKLATSGFEFPDEVVKFEDDPMGEEAIVLLELVGRAQEALNSISEERDQLRIDLEAEKEINKRNSESKKFRGEDYAQGN